MKWNKYTIATKAKATEYICDMLIGLGITGMQIDDNLGITEEEKKAQFIDYVPTLKDSDDAYITFYTETKENAEDEKSDSYNLTGVEVVKQTLQISDEELLEKIREELLDASKFMDIGLGTITKDVTVDTDWKDNWKEFFKEFNVGCFNIKPLWDKDVEEKRDLSQVENTDKTIFIDPGMAFGTGKHETTALCIRELEKYVKPNMNVFDVGCGSAILSIAARKLGAGKMLLTDIDPEAVSVVPHNLEINDIKVDENITVLKGDLLSDENIQSLAKSYDFDIVVANILADVIIPLSAVVDRYLKKGGIFISSGIIYTRADEVKEAVVANANLELLDVKRDGDWVMISARKK
ncbi:ribosomal protein L11 methyltransferase [Eubacterium uniforme]|uniref:Ribosomal protein L11 methyltransferase n=1 Tax=Eubacterium uniforme TaxID=39495 RepID=A0A1T4VNA1_9FIRM|nr:50S ribosomal protein L11 methyltransferase [Eubacterium uniforme]SKA66443.1 ribosomal protein L11 methyltransferase [Eubacterium uniforme]